MSRWLICRSTLYYVWDIWKYLASNIQMQKKHSIIAFFPVPQIDYVVENYISRTFIFYMNILMKIPLSDIG